MTKRPCKNLMSILNHQKKKKKRVCYAHSSFSTLCMLLSFNYMEICKLCMVYIVAINQNILFTRSNCFLNMGENLEWTPPPTVTPVRALKGLISWVPPGYRELKAGERWQLPLDFQPSPYRWKVGICLRFSRSCVFKSRCCYVMSLEISSI